MCMRAIDLLGVFRGHPDRTTVPKTCTPAQRALPAQHAHNPVDWMEWGDAAFARARAEDKPIFLSIGYSTCRGDDDGAVRLHASPDTRRARSGERTTIVATMTIAKGWHVNGAAPVPKGLVAIELTIVPPLGLASIRHPAGAATKLSFSDQPVPLMSGKVNLVADVVIPRGTPPGPTTAWLDLETQPCNDQLCLRPRTLRIEVPFVIETAPSTQPAAR